MFRAPPSAKQLFHLFLIKPSHYDDEGYVIQWARSSIPANTLAAVYGLARDSAKRHALGDDVEIKITAWDETWLVSACSDWSAVMPDCCISAMVASASCSWPASSDWLAAQICRTLAVFWRAPARCIATCSCVT